MMNEGSLAVSGPMFKGAESWPWKSIHRKSGAHYNTYACEDINGMAALRELFPAGKADSMNVVLFSTSGVHGTYRTIEDAEHLILNGGVDEYGDRPDPDVTFLVVQPRIVCLRYGNCQPRTVDDIAFLKGLRESSVLALTQIGQ